MAATSLEEIFQLFDASNSGKLEKSDFYVATKAYGLDLTRERVAELLEPHESETALTRDQFVSILKPLESERPDPIEAAFKLFDADSTGVITLDNLKAVARELGEQMTDEQLVEMLKEAGGSEAGGVSLESFKSVMRRTQVFS